MAKENFTIASRKTNMILFIGGGFHMAAVPAFFHFWESLIIALHRDKKNVAIFALGYSLSPAAKYPTQLIQAVDGLRYIIAQRQIEPKSIVLAGDSAGAALAFGVLLHLTHKHPAIDLLKLETPLAGIALIGYPGATNDTCWPEGAEMHCGGDIIDLVVVEAWMRSYLGDSEPDYYTDPITAPITWFEKLPTKRMLMLAGGNEVLKPMIDIMVQRLKVRTIIPKLFL